MVVGASSGIGAATATALVEHGARVICASRNAGRLAGLVQQLGESSIALALDVTDPESVNGLFERLPLELHSIDILVNSAGHDTGGRRRLISVRSKNGKASSTRTLPA